MPMSEKFLELIEEGKFSIVRNELLKLNVVDIAQILEELQADQMLLLFRLLPKEIAVDVFTYMSTEQQQYIIEAITDKEIKNIIDKLFLDDTVDLIEEMPSNIVKKILKNTDPELRELINQFLKYPENSAGSIMTIEYVDLKSGMTVQEALEHIRETGVEKETIDTCYVLDDSRKLEGIVPLRKLILCDSSTIIRDIMVTNFVKIQTHEDQEHIAQLFKKYDLLAMPVVDHEERLVGIITIDDVVDIMEQETTEDFQIMAAIHPSQEEYLKTSVINLAKNRILWLLVLMISATFTGYIIRSFESIMQANVILAAFIPMLMDTGGNAGSQTAVTVIRCLALGEIKLGDVLKVLWKELRVSFIVGIILSLVNFVRLYLLEGTGLMIALTVCISLFLTVILAKVTGAVLPILAKRLKLDPAIMASPMITTIVDAVALIAYFTLATLLLGL